MQNTRNPNIHFLDAGMPYHDELPSHSFWKKRVGQGSNGQVPQVLSAPSGFSVARPPARSRRDQADGWSRRCALGHYVAGGVRVCLRSLPKEVSPAIRGSRTTRCAEPHNQGLLRTGTAVHTCFRDTARGRASPASLPTHTLCHRVFIITTNYSCSVSCHCSLAAVPPLQ